MALRIGLMLFPRVQQLDLTGPYEVFAMLFELPSRSGGTNHAAGDDGNWADPDADDNI